MKWTGLLIVALLVGGQLRLLWRLEQLERRLSSFEKAGGSMSTSGEGTNDDQ